MEYGCVERVLSSKLRRTPPAAAGAADRQGGRQPVVQFPLGGGGGLTHRPLPPAPRVSRRHLCACIKVHLASPTTGSYKSTELKLNAQHN